MAVSDMSHRELATLDTPFPMWLIEMSGVYKVWISGKHHWVILTSEVSTVLVRMPLDLSYCVMTQFLPLPNLLLSPFFHRCDSQDTP